MRLDGRGIALKPVFEVADALAQGRLEPVLLQAPPPTGTLAVLMPARRLVPLSRVEDACSTLLKTRLRFVTTEVGGCAVDIDNEHDFDVAALRYAEWSKAQTERAVRLYGALPAAGASRERAS